MNKIALQEALHKLNTVDESKLKYKNESYKRNKKLREANDDAYNCPQGTPALVTYSGKLYLQLNKTIEQTIDYFYDDVYGKQEYIALVNVFWKNDRCPVTYGSNVKNTVYNDIHGKIASIEIMGVDFTAYTEDYSDIEQLSYVISKLKRIYPYVKITSIVELDESLKRNKKLREARKSSNNVYKLYNGRVPDMNNAFIDEVENVAFEMVEDEGFEDVLNHPEDYDDLTEQKFADELVKRLVKKFNISTEFAKHGAYQYILMKPNMDIYKNLSLKDKKFFYNLFEDDMIKAGDYPTANTLSENDLDYYLTYGTLNGDVEDSWDMLKASNMTNESFKRNKKLNELMDIKQFKAFNAEIESAVFKIIDKYENMDENFEWKDVDDALRSLVYKCAERWPNDPLPAR